MQGTSDKTVLKENSISNVVFPLKETAIEKLINRIRSLSDTETLAYNKLSSY